MSNLQSIATAKLLQSIPINDDNADVIDKFVLQYLSNRPQVLDKHFNQSSLYHVFFREEDPYETTTTCQDIELVKTFATEISAREWIKENGADFCEMEEYNRERPVVLMIVEYGNEDSVHLYGIAQMKHPTFSFSEEGYKMCLREHKIAFYQREVGVIPYWLYHYSESWHENKIIRGCMKVHIEDLHKYWIYTNDDIGQKQKNFDKYHTFQSDPDGYIPDI